MARLEAYPMGIAVIHLDTDDIDRIRAVSEPLYRTFLNGRAVATGEAEPLAMTLTPSFAMGHPLVPLPCGGLAFEIDHSLVGTIKKAIVVTHLEVSVDAGSIVISETNASVRGPGGDARDNDLEDRLQAALVQAGPLTEIALQLMMPDADPAETTATLAALVADGVVCQDGDHYRSGQDVKAERTASVRTKRSGTVPRAALTTIVKAIAQASRLGIDIKSIVEKTGLDRALVEQAVDHLCESARIFKFEDLYTIPDDEDRNGLFDMITEGLEDLRGKSVTVDGIVGECYEYHPAWVRRTLDTMVRRKQVDFDGNLYSYRRTSRPHRSPGRTAVKTIIEAAGAKGIIEDELFDRMRNAGITNDVTRRNIDRLIEEGRVIPTEDHIFIWKATPDKPKPRARVNRFKDDIRRLLFQAGTVGLTRERIMSNFPEDKKNRVSGVLNHLVSRSEARLWAGVYTLRRPQKTELALSRE